MGVVVIALATAWSIPRTAVGRALRVYVANVEVDTVATSAMDSVKASRGVIESRQLGYGRSAVITVQKDKRPVWFGPSVGFDVFVREGGTGQYKAGVIPGVGYGIKWGKKGGAKTPDSPRISLDLFLQGALADELASHDGADYFDIDVLPVVTVVNWVSIGWGVRFKMGLNGLDGSTKSLFSFGVRKGI